MGDVTRVTKEALDGQRVIKVFNAQEQEAREFEAVNEHNRRSNMKLIAAKATSNPVVQFIASIGLLIGRIPTARMLFDPEYIKALFLRGMEQGKNGTAFLAQPPDLSNRPAPMVK